MLENIKKIFEENESVDNKELLEDVMLVLDQYLGFLECINESSDLNSIIDGIEVLKRDLTMVKLSILKNIYDIEDEWNYMTT